MGKKVSGFGEKRIARVRGHLEVVELLNEFEQNSQKVRKDLQNSLGIEGCCLLLEEISLHGCKLALGFRDSFGRKRAWNLLWGLLCTRLSERSS